MARETGQMLPIEVRRKYAEWRRMAVELNDFAQKIGQDEEFRTQSEDLGDWVDAVTTLLSFSPDAGPLD
jgi:hypothetical protein